MHSMIRPQILIVDDTPELLDLLTHLLRENGFEPIPAGRGREAQKAVRRSVPALAVIDILLPDSTGYQLADTLRRIAPDLPIIFISGVFKGDRQAMVAKQQHNAAAFFEKPFDAHALLDAIRAHVPAGEPPAPEAAPALLGNEPACEEDRRLDPMEISGIVRFADGKPHFSSAQSAAAAPSIILQPPSFNPAANAGLSASDASDGCSSVERGILDDNLPSLINAFHQSQETGELILTRGRVKKVIFFRRGRPVFARSNVISDRFGQFLVRLGKITDEQRLDAYQIAGGDESRLAEGFRILKLLSAEECEYYLGQQIKSIIYSTFCWEDGSYTMTLRNSSPEFPLELNLHPGNLILRAVRRLYKSERLQRLLSLDDRPIPSQQPTYALNELELESWEAKLLTMTDGMHTVSQLITASQQSALKVMAFIYAMMSLTILDRWRQY